MTPLKRRKTPNMDQDMVQDYHTYLQLYSQSVEQRRAALNVGLEMMQLLRQQLNHVGHLQL